MLAQGPGAAASVAPWPGQAVGAEHALRDELRPVALLELLEGQAPRRDRAARDVLLVFAADLGETRKIR
jgi:hypothetical protein